MTNSKLILYIMCDIIS